MPKLIKLKWVLLIMTFCHMLLIGSLGYIAASYRFEKSFMAKILVLKDTPPRIVFTSGRLYHLNLTSYITIKINNKYYQTLLQHQQYDVDHNLLSYHLSNQNIPLLGQTTVPVTVVYGSETLLTKIIGIV